MANTPSRNVRIPDDEWESFGAACDANGTTPSTELRRAVQRYLGRPPTDVQTVNSPTAETAIHVVGYLSASTEPAVIAALGAAMNSAQRNGYQLPDAWAEYGAGAAR